MLVDGDNFLLKDYAFYLNDVFNKNQDIILNNIVKVTKKEKQNLIGEGLLY